MNPGDPNDALRAENAALKQVLHQRGEPMFLAVMDALDTLCAMAEAGHPQAQALLTKWNRVLQRAQDAISRLAVVRNGQPH